MGILQDYKFHVGEELHIGNMHGIITKCYRDENNRKTYDYTCLDCGYENTKSEILIAKGIGCSCCYNRIVVKGINDIPTTAPWMIPYFQGGKEEASQYTKSCSKMITPICPYCSRVKDIPVKINQIYNRHGIACVCSDGLTYPNKFIYGLAEQLFHNGVITEYEREFPIEDKSYDMRIKVQDVNYLIEMDGGLNHGAVIIAHKKTKPISSTLFRNDLIKDELAADNGFPLIRVDCYESNFEYIKHNVLTSELARIANLDNINWTALEEFCCKNIVKEVCEYKSTHPDLFSPEIGEVFHLTQSTIRHYLHTGNNLGWCKYDGKAEMKRRNSISKDSNTKIPVVIVNNLTGETVTFESMTDFVRKSNQYFESPLTHSKLEKRFKKQNPILNYENYDIYKQYKEE